MVEINTRGLRRRLVAASVAGRYDIFLGVGGGLAVLGLILFLRALGSPEGAVRAWQMFHVNWIYFTGLSAALVAFAAVMKVTNARWPGFTTRFAEAAVGFSVVSLIGLVLIFTVGYGAIYGPMQSQMETLQHGKRIWLSHGFMFARLFVGLAALGWLGWRLVRTDMLPDMLAARDAVTDSRRRRFERMTAGYDGSEGAQEWVERRVRVLGPRYVVLYAAVITLVAFDCIMALQPHWYSNLLGGWVFMGAFLNAHSWLALLTIFGAAHLGVKDLVSPKQRHDLGKLHFGFTVFWAYLMWAQFLVIWYGNMPEETGFVFARLWGPWLPIGTIVFCGVFVIPFIGLLGVEPKKNRFTLGLFATISLLSMWLERYLLVMPSVTPLPGPAAGIPEIGPTLLFLGLFLFVYGLFARSFPMVSPRLVEITLWRELGHHGIEVFDHEDTERDYVHDSDVERRHGPR
jgi:hypothetical protein